MIHIDATLCDVRMVATANTYHGTANVLFHDNHTGKTVTKEMPLKDFAVILHAALLGDELDAVAFQDAENIWQALDMPIELRPMP